MNRIKDFLWQKIIDFNAWEVYRTLRTMCFPDVEACFAVELAYYEKHAERLVNTTPLDVTRAVFARAALLALRKKKYDLAWKIAQVVEAHESE